MIIYTGMEVNKSVKCTFLYDKKFYFVTNVIISKHFFKVKVETMSLISIGIRIINYIFFISLGALFVWKKNHNYW